MESRINMQRLNSRSANMSRAGSSPRFWSSTPHLLQESRAQATLAALKSRLALNASVRRDGAWKTPMLLKTVQSKKIDPTRLITHRFKLDQIVEAHDMFARAADTHALKVIIAA